MSIAADKLNTYRRLLSWSNPTVATFNGTPLALLYRFAIIERDNKGTALEMAIPIKLAIELSEALSGSLVGLSDMRNWDEIQARGAAGEDVTGHPVLDFALNPMSEVLPQNYTYSDRGTFTSFHVHVFPTERWVVLVGHLKSGEKLTLKLHPSAAWMLSDEILAAVSRASKARPGTLTAQ
ncbi:hypothetical protein [Ferrovibrio sp.]|uniref:hypothetical protein n=1 Tax=Ferrovibrio sp. TaxID=1917215 RepID=UPI0025C0DA51|nr:hypothetical protein [Ferrovibrio sp.]